MASQNFDAQNQRRSCALVPLGDQETPPGSPISASSRGFGLMVGRGGHPLETADDSPETTEPNQMATILDSGRGPSTPAHGRDFIAPRNELSMSMPDASACANQARASSSPFPTDGQLPARESGNLALTTVAQMPRLRLELGGIPHRDPARDLLVTGVPDWLLQAFMPDTQNSESGGGRVPPEDPEHTRRLMPPPHQSKNTAAATLPVSLWPPGSIFG